MTSSLKSIPSVDRILQMLGETPLPRPVVLKLVREELGRVRAEGTVPTSDLLFKQIQNRIEQVARWRLRPVINGTGILIHTNLGRSPLALSAAQAVYHAAAEYTNLEIDLDSGGRGGRAAYLEIMLALVCGAEAAAVVNNCAAALVLILRHFTRTRKEVLLSRGELVQIGGGFRIPEILEASGARLREVGTTNRTSLEDYARAIGADAALILKVHQSNFFLGGYVEVTPTQALAELAHRHGLPLVEDLGSGALIRTEQFPGVDHEPTPAEVLAHGVDLVCFSGDKLLGGPQAGIIAGRREWVAGLTKEPFFRALRCDKLVLSALEATVDLYLRRPPAALPEGLPLIDMLKLCPAELRKRAERICRALEGLPFGVAVGKGTGQAGGGTLPRTQIQSVTVEVEGETRRLEGLASDLRLGAPPIVGYISDGRLKFDLRTVFPNQDEILSRRLREAVERLTRASPSALGS